jgi:uroporphyrinogen-III synthase
VVTNLDEVLAGRVIAIAETRELDVLAGLLERRGARVLRYPLVRIIDAPDPAPVLAWTRRFCAGDCDDLILLTGEGLQRLLGCIERNEPSLAAAFLAALGRVRKITRGPKPARALRALGLAADLPATPPTTAGVIETLRRVDLAGRRVGVQLYGSDPNRALIEFLEAAGAAALPVAPYAYAEVASDEAVRELVAHLAAGAIDALVFTSKAQVERLFRAAPPSQVRSALAATHIAAVGPMVAAALADHGVTAGTMPPQAWFMKPLTTALAEALSTSGGGSSPNPDDSGA